ncbi:hypothetical protein [Paraflavitalea speifideaquila]|uniref:hypothetical protein n=1 Tax=Paraflavitalea speifideaquila TaxID=3076558 RepID=UPI0028E4730D|nr:hypothetical protein [Paraflavitalea speifideiaquila]
MNASQYQQYMNESYGANTITDSMVRANNINWPDEVFRHGSQANYQVAIAGEVRSCSIIFRSIIMTRRV